MPYSCIPLIEAVCMKLCRNNMGYVFFGCISSCWCTFFNLQIIYKRGELHKPVANWINRITLPEYVYPVRCIFFCSDVWISHECTCNIMLPHKTRKQTNPTLTVSDLLINFSFYIFNFSQKTSHISVWGFRYLSNFLLSRDAAVRVSSALRSLTSVFGMGTGVSSALLSLSSTEYSNLLYLNSVISYLIISNHFPFLSWSSPRSISIRQLNTLLHLHLWPINHIVYVGPY